jgi:hypothetical protein
LPSSSDSRASECFLVTPAQPALATTAGGAVPLGTAVSDTASLTGTAHQPGTGGPAGSTDGSINPGTPGVAAGGTITFSLFGPSDTACGALVFTSSPVTVSGNGTYGPVSFTPATVGTYHWAATYSGNLPNTKGTDHNTSCTDANENVTVSNSTTVTTPVENDGVTPIPAGGLPVPTTPSDSAILVKDQAVINVTGAGSFTGTVSFHLCGPFMTPSTTLCTTGGVPISSQGIATNGTYTSAAATVTEAGRYCWRADFTSTTPGVPTSTDSRSTECFLITPVTPTLATTGGGPVLLGQAVSDTATLSGTAHQPGTGGPAGSTDGSINPGTPGVAAGGNIVFQLYGPSSTGCGVLVFTSSQVAVNDDGTYGPVNFTPATVGTYHWVATYSGNLPNTKGTNHNTSCNDANEDVMVIAVPSSLTTAQSFIPNDSTTVSASQGGNLSGTVSFQLFESTNCAAGTAIYSPPPVPVSGASPQTVSTSNTSVSTTAANVSWLVSYASNNPAQRSIPATCVETSALTISNGGTITSP